MYHRASSPSYSNESKPTPVATKALKSQPLTQAPRARIAMPEKVAATISEGCRTFWENLRSVDVAQIVEYPPRVNEIPSGVACDNQPVPEWMQGYHQRFTEACKDFDVSKSNGMTAKEWRNSTNQCHLQTLVYRAAISSWLTDGTDVATISDPAVLTDKVVIELQQGNLENSAKVSERLLEVAPESYPAAEANMVAYTMMAIRDGRNEVNHPLWNKASDAIDVAWKLNPGSNEAITASLLTEYMRHRDIPRLEALARRAAIANPTSSVPQKFMAFTRFQSGDGHGSIRLLQNAESMGDSEAAAILQRIRTGQKSPFQLGLSSSFVAFEAK